MTGMEIPTALALTSLAAQGGSMLTENPTAKRVLQGVSLASGLGNVAGLGASATGAAGATGAGVAAKTTAQGAAGALKAADPSLAGLPASFIAGPGKEAASFGSRLKDILKSGTIPIMDANVPLSMLTGIGSYLLPEGPAKKVLGGVGLASGLAGLGLNLADAGASGSGDADLPASGITEENLPPSLETSTAKSFLPRPIAEETLPGSSDPISDVIRLRRARRFGFGG